MFDVRCDTSGLKYLAKQVAKHYGAHPEVLLGTIAQWWWKEGLQVFRSKGSRIQSPWKRLSSQYAAVKGSAPINVLTGRLIDAMSGVHGHFARKVGDGRIKVGITYEPEVFHTLNKWRPLTGTTSTQMKTLNGDVQNTITKRIDKKLTRKRGRRKV